MKKCNQKMKILRNRLQKLKLSCRNVIKNANFKIQITKSDFVKKKYNQKMKISRNRLQNYEIKI